VPDFQVPAESLVFPPLSGKPAKEKFDKNIKPIKPIKVK